MRAAVAAATLLLAAGCIPNEGPLMSPFEDCLKCHGKGEGPAWSAAGTWARGAKIEVVDAGGKSVTMTGNKVGNFYTAESLRFPLTVYVDGARMPAPVTYGGCNICHHGREVTTGPLMAPGSDCLSCHGPGGIATRLYAAGTFTDVAVGTSVQVGTSTTTTNAVGNFYFTAPVTLSSASVGGRTMINPGASCNTCHNGTVGGAD